jgi:hypothetical protein
MINFLLVLGIIGAIFMGAVQGGWNPAINIGSDAQRGGSAMYNMIKGGKKFKKLKR